MESHSLQSFYRSVSKSVTLVLESIFLKILFSTIKKNIENICKHQIGASVVFICIDKYYVKYRSLEELDCSKISILCILFRHFLLRHIGFISIG